MALLALVLFNATSVKAQIVINEYSCSNQGGISATDLYGNTPDVFELYNKSGSNANISGFYLSDDPGNLTKWQFPSGTTISGNGFIKVFASGRDTAATGVGEYHTSFKLTQTRPEIIILSRPNGTIMDSVTLRATMKDHGRGRDPDGSTNWKVYTGTNCSFGSANGTTNYIDYKKRPVFNITPGFFNSSQTITLSTTDPNVMVYYTLNGDNPNGNPNSLYFTPFVIDSTRVIRAYAKSLDPLYYDSFTETNTYFIREPRDYTFPVVSCAGEGIITQLFASQTVVFGNVEYFGTDNVFKYEAGGTMDKHGNDSWAFPQKGFDFVADDEYGYSYTNKQQFFDDPKLGWSDRDKHQKIMFKAGASDNFPFGGQAGGNGRPCHMRDAFDHSYSFRKNLHLDGRRYEPIILFINGKYWGVYELREKFDEDYTDYYYNQPEIDNLKYWGGLNVEDGTSTGWTNLYAFIMANSMNNVANFNLVEAQLSFMSLIDYMIFNSFAVNSDFINWNSAWWRGLDPTKDKHKWRYWNWDMDNTWNLGENYSGLPTTNYDSNPCDYENTFPQSAGANQGHAAILTKLMQNDTFKSMWINRYADLLNTALNCDSLMDHLNYFVNFLTPEMDMQSRRWGDTISKWIENVDTMRNFMLGRCQYIDSAIVNCYNVTGPWNLCVDVYPPNSGTVQLNSIMISNFLWNGDYFGGTAMSASANAGDFFTFDHWEVTNIDRFNQDSLKNDTLWFNFDTTSCLKAVFRYKEPYELNGEPGVPTAFTPNGDGFNDLLNVYGTLNATKFEFEIYNRWGQVLFKSKEKNKSWDGKFSGSDVPEGVYAYRFMCTIEGKDFVKNGNVTVLR